MAEYIKKEDIEQKIQDGLNNLVLGHDAIEVLGMIYETPTADVAPVRHGRWENYDGMGYLVCSECRDVYIDEDWLKDGKWNYCPNCGARMDGDKNA